MSTANQKQALVHIYNIVTGSVASLDPKFKTEVTKAAQQLKAAGSEGVHWFLVQDKNAQLLVIAINQALLSGVYYCIKTNKKRIERESCSVSC
jgi:molybdopterin-containing oxidoreductase family iron-sulfur binding subunit